MYDNTIKKPIVPGTFRQGNPTNNRGLNNRPANNRPANSRQPVQARLGITIIIHSFIIKSSFKTLN